MWPFAAAEGELSAPAPARRAAYEVLRRTFEHDAYTDRAFPAAAKRHHLDGRERSAAQRLAYGAVRGRATADHLIAKLTKRGADRLDGPVLAALRLGLWELLNSDATPPRAVVNEAVELAKRGGAGRGTGLVNAVMRRAAAGEAARILGSLDENDQAEAAILHSYPDWIADLWASELGADQALCLMKAFNRPAENSLRINLLRADPGSYRLKGARPPAPEPAELAPAEALVVEGPLAGAPAEAIDRGEVLPQARASQAVVGLLDPRPGQRILDLCGGPGVKATQIAARMRGEGTIVCVEPRPDRAAQIRDLAGSLGAESIEVVVADGTEFDRDLPFDRILIDPPCTALGTLASRPDARWRRSPGDRKELAALQRRLLERGIGLLAPGGTLVFSTCTISRAEGPDCISAVAAHLPGVEIDDLGSRAPGLACPWDSRFLLTRPDRDRTDGFFIARIRSAQA